MELSNGKYRDFDAARSEAKGEPVVFKIGGQVFQCPARVPAGVIVDVLRAQSDPGKQAGIILLAGIMQKLLGDSQFEALMNIIELSELPDIAEYVVNAYTGTGTATENAVTPPETAG